MATHSSVLAWRIPGTGSLAGCCLRVAQSRTRLKRLSIALAYETKTDSDIETRLVAAKGEWEGRSGSLGLADASYHI